MGLLYLASIDVPLSWTVVQHLSCLAELYVVDVVLFLLLLVVVVDVVVDLLLSLFFIDDVVILNLVVVDL